MVKHTSPIRAARKQANLSGEILAERLGCTVSWYRTVERAPGLASPELLGRIAAALNVPIAALLTQRHRSMTPF